MDEKLMEDYERVFSAARALHIKEGGDSEYDRALLELATDLTGYPRAMVAEELGFDMRLLYG